MKKIIVFILIAFALLFAARQILMPKLVERGFNRLVSENVGVDRSAALEMVSMFIFAGQGRLYLTPNVAALA